MLSAEQIEEVKGELVKEGVPVRFMHEGCSLDIVTGGLTQKGINVMYQTVFWNFTKETSLKIAKWLDVQAVFS